jgi:hypothetical protein
MERYSLDGIDDFKLPIGDHSAVLQVVDASNLVDANMRGRKGRLQVHILNKEQKVVIVYLCQAEDEAGVLGAIFTRELELLLDILI